MEVTYGDVVLCEFYFSDLKSSKKRPVLVFRDNLPYDDFVSIPISSRITHLHPDEILIKPEDFRSGTIPVISKLMLRKTFVVSKSNVLKKYGTLETDSLRNIQKQFCTFFACP